MSRQFHSLFQRLTVALALAANHYILFSERLGAPVFYNYLVTALRNIVRHKLYSFINICGLAVGLACAIFIILFVRDEISYDRWIVSVAPMLPRVGRCRPKHRSVSVVPRRGSNARPEGAPSNKAKRPRQRGRYR